jgi:uncharacterized membrane protein
MDRKLFQVAIWMMWLAVPLTALNYWRVWERLPARMAVHFDIDGQPNGWTSREMSLRLALIITAFMIAIFMIAGYVVRKTSAVSNSSAWAMVVFFYVVLGFVYFMNDWVVRRNLNQSRPALLGELMEHQSVSATGPRITGPEGS